MKRRELLVGAGVALAAVTTLGATRAEAAPAAPKSAPAGLIAAATNCERAAQACLRHCLAMLGSGNAAMAACAKSVADLIPAVNALGAIAAGGSTHTTALAAVVAMIAKDCKVECDKHPTMEPCKACGDSCGALIAAIGWKPSAR